MLSLAIFFSIWGLPLASPTLSPAENMKQQQQPTEHYAVASPFIPEQQLKPDQRPGKKEQRKSYISKSLEWISRHESAITAMSTFVMAVFTIALFRSTHLLWKSGKEHSEQQLRAYVFVDAAYIQLVYAGGHIEAFIKIKNGGQTPAYGITARLSVWTDKQCPSQQFPTGDWKPSTVCVGPGCTFDFRPRIEERLIEIERDEIEFGERAIYVAGEISYKDIFDELQTVRIRSFFMNHGQEYSLEGKLPLRASEDGNKCT